MAESKKRSFNIMNVVTATGSGVVANLGMEALESKVEAFQKKPILSPLAFNAFGAGLVYFGKPGSMMEAAGYGACGAAGSEFANLQRDKNEGFSRATYSKKGLSLNAAELDALNEEEEEADSRMSGWQDEEGYS